MVKIDKGALLAALRNSTQNPRAVEQVIARLEAGEFEQEPAPARAPKPPQAETAVAGEEGVEVR